MTAVGTARLARACRRILAAGTLLVAGAGAAGAVLIAAAGTAGAGMDVSLERQFLRLQEIERQVESSPAYRESAELEDKLRALQMRLEQLAPRDPAEVAAEREALRRQIDGLERQLGTLQKVIVDIREQASRGGERLFPGVTHRIAAFTLDDPHGTGLGDAVSFLLAKKLLFSTRVSSFAIVNYRQGVERTAAGGPAYFDRVDAITRDQDYLLALWGRLARTDDGVRIDSFLQLPAAAGTTPFVGRIRLPEAMGSGMLTARLKPDRIPVQSLAVDGEGVAALRQAAEEVARLRAEPKPTAEIVDRLGEAGSFREDKVYSIAEVRGAWVRLRFADGTGGWTSVDAFCTGACRTLMDVATFANDMVAASSGLAARPVPQSLTREAAAISRQAAALAAVTEEPAAAVELAGAWAGGAYGPPPGGAGFANVLAVARVNAALDRARAEQPEFDRIRLPRGVLAPITEALARASVADPGDVDVVENLAVLFAAMGDEDRHKLALDIAADLKAR